MEKIFSHFLLGGAIFIHTYEDFTDYTGCDRGGSAQGHFFFLETETSLLDRAVSLRVLTKTQVQMCVAA